MVTPTVCLPPNSLWAPKGQTVYLSTCPHDLTQCPACSKWDLTLEVCTPNLLPLLVPVSLTGNMNQIKNLSVILEFIGNPVGFTLMYPDPNHFCHLTATHKYILVSFLYCQIPLPLLFPPDSLFSTQLASTFKTHLTISIAQSSSDLPFYVEENPNSLPQPWGLAWSAPHPTYLASSHSSQAVFLTVPWIQSEIHFWFGNSELASGPESCVI